MKLTQKQLQKMILREMKTLMKETVDAEMGAANQELADILNRRADIKDSEGLINMQWSQKVEGNDKVYRYQIYAASGIEFVTSDAPGDREGFVINIRVPNKNDDV